MTYGSTIKSSKEFLLLFPSTPTRLLNSFGGYSMNNPMTMSEIILMPERIFLRRRNVGKKVLQQLRDWRRVHGKMLKRIIKNDEALSLREFDIVGIVQRYTKLTNSGQNFKGLCPFHSEKTPSFMVSPSRQIFHCFGCGTDGNAITFIMKKEGTSYGEAISKLQQQHREEVLSYG